MRVHRIYPRITAARAAALAALVLLVPPTHPAAAQTTLRIGGGATFPTGYYAASGSSASSGATGWVGVVDLATTVGSPHFLVGLEGFYGRTEGTEVPNYGYTADVRFSHYGFFWIGRFRTAQRQRVVSPYLQAGLGFLWGAVDIERTDTDPNDFYQAEHYAGSDILLGLHLAAGLDVPVGPVALWLEGRYLRSSAEGDRSPAYFGALGGLRLRL